ncbi:uncharacterized protein MONOS_5647 [Monocercomonoides exilis]|uniref:uncharacterized protein n=1 Tax=Monocercomonoides exilis TaxID=2049356 RepID=UPI00355AB359|nr:hypothetical protein MONOS_5647 [Monocercomonoides exilis]|eukprot:MONOS_5647.1-p1 / transcript=MONOS_5647.1 / gene=MONOS_5647 / organism=Monocercomonoides_exilis_PA203 / gene_product=unspecified product / transcript_product=unspecified product / location=Mono_scaffold00167:13370-15358(+) / protein_length=612 / sequence_SO=supercontig / SO=protein_coding / is_pseudo=false
MEEMLTYREIDHDLQIVLNQLFCEDPKGEKILFQHSHDVREMESCTTVQNMKAKLKQTHLPSQSKKIKELKERLVNLPKNYYSGTNDTILYEDNQMDDAREEISTSPFHQSGENVDSNQRPLPVQKNAQNFTTEFLKTTFTRRLYAQSSTLRSFNSMSDTGPILNKLTQLISKPQSQQRKNINQSTNLTKEMLQAEESSNADEKEAFITVNERKDMICFKSNVIKSIESILSKHYLNQNVTGEKEDASNKNSTLTLSSSRSASSPDYAALLPVVNFFIALLSDNSNCKQIIKQMTFAISFFCMILQRHSNVLPAPVIEGILFLLLILATQSDSRGILLLAQCGILEGCLTVMAMMRYRYNEKCAAIILVLIRKRQKDWIKERVLSILDSDAKEQKARKAQWETKHRNRIDAIHELLKNSEDLFCFENSINRIDEVELFEKEVDEEDTREAARKEIEKSVILNTVEVKDGHHFQFISDYYYESKVDLRTTKTENILQPLISAFHPCNSPLLSGADILSATAVAPAWMPESGLVLSSFSGKEPQSLLAKIFASLAMLLLNEGKVLNDATLKMMQVAKTIFRSTLRIPAFKGIETIIGEVFSKIGKVKGVYDMN